MGGRAVAATHREPLPSCLSLIRTADGDVSAVGSPTSAGYCAAARFFDLALELERLDGQLFVAGLEQEASRPPR